MVRSQNISFPLEEVAAHIKWLETKKKTLGRDRTENPDLECRYV